MQGPLDERFDYIVAADVAEPVPDLDRMMAVLAGMLTDRGIAVVVTANPLWSPILHAAEPPGGRPRAVGGRTHPSGGLEAAGSP
jgi:2-polyprenyl-3-methyl-5-hydroxy-6-metoxy-1,4-benzoquinol methylase